MQVITRDEWLKLSFFKRWRLVRYCKHPFEKSVLVGTVRNRDMDTEDSDCFFIAHVRQCCLCREHFLDTGLTFQEKYRTAKGMTSKAATAAHKALRNPNSSKSAKTAAGSALTQPRMKGGK